MSILLSRSMSIFLSNHVSNAAWVFYYWGLYDTSIVFSYNAKSSAVSCYNNNYWGLYDTSYNNTWCSMCILLLFLIFAFHKLPCVTFRWWSSIPLVVRYVFRVQRLLNIYIKLITSQLKLFFFFYRICLLFLSSCLGLVK